MKLSLQSIGGLKVMNNGHDSAKIKVTLTDTCIGAKKNKKPGVKEVLTSEN